jgi:hypothetical protein
VAKCTYKRWFSTEEKIYTLFQIPEVNRVGHGLVFQPVLLEVFLHRTRLIICLVEEMLELTTDVKTKLTI